MSPVRPWFITPLVFYWSLIASPTVLQISFAFMYLQKSLKNTYPTVWHLDFAILLTWQKERKDWHICQTGSHLTLENWREVINAKPLEIVSFHLCHIFLRLGKLPHLPNQLCKTVWDALRIRYSMIPLPRLKKLKEFIILKVFLSWEFLFCNVIIWHYNF